MQDRSRVISPTKWLSSSVPLDGIIEGVEPAVDARSALRPELVVTCRLLVFPSEVFRLPSSSRAVRVRFGVAWVTHAGRDIVGREGETISLEQGRGFAIASALRGIPVVIEVLARGH